MSDPDKEKPWQLVADAGFRDVVLGLGFEAVSKTHWQKELDEVVWRVSLTRGEVDVPRSYAFYTGVEIKGLDAVVVRVTADKYSSRLPGTGKRVHGSDELQFVIMDKQRAALDAEWEAKHAAARAAWRGLLRLPPRIPDWDVLKVPRKPHFLREIADVPFRERRKWSMRNFGNSFTLEGYDLQDATDHVTGQWLAIEHEALKDNADARSFCDRAWAPGSSAFNQADEIAFAAATFTGATEHIQAMAERVFFEAQASVWWHYRQNRREGHHDFFHRLDRWMMARHLKEEPPLTKHQLAMARKRSMIRRSQRILETSKELGLGLEDPGLDWAFLERGRNN